MTRLKSGAYVTADAIDAYALDKGISASIVHSWIRDAFKEAGCNIDPDLGEYGTFKGNTDKAIIWGNLGDVLSWVSLPVSELEGVFEVTPAEILPPTASQPILLQAVEGAPEGTKFRIHSAPGALAIKVKDGVLKGVWRLQWENGAAPNHSLLLTREYEIVEDKLEPWKSTSEDKGWLPGPGGTATQSRHANYGALQSEAAAAHKSKYDEILDGIRNMPGAFKGDGSRVYWDYRDRDFHTSRKTHFSTAPSIMDIPFDTLENAKAAADWANGKL